MEKSKKIALGACKECPAAETLRLGITDYETAEIKQYPKDYIVDEFAYHCFKRTHLLCKGFCDEVGITQEFIDSLTPNPA